MSLRSLSLILLLGAATGCVSSRSEPLPNHDSASAELRGVERETGDGPYLTGTTETFHLSADEGLSAFRWSATTGSLHSSGDRATWKLPATEGVASLTVTALNAKGEEKTATWNFQIREATVTSRDALLSQAIPVLDGGTFEQTGSSCDVYYEGNTNVHLGFKNDTHPALLYGMWNGSAWNVQVVDGMGFNVGGRVEDGWAMTMDPTGKPHFAYVLNSDELWYATWTGTSWIRERVDNTYSMTANSSYSKVSIALNPAQANRPSIAYVSYNVSGYPRVTIAIRTAANTWTNTQLVVPGASTTSSQTLVGQILHNSAGLLLVPAAASALTAQLLSWDGTTTSAFTVATANQNYWDTWADAAWAGPNRVIYRTNKAMFDVTVGTPLNTSTSKSSAVELNGSNQGDLAWQGGKPYLLHSHGGALELVTPTAAGFWTYTQLGNTTSAGQPALAVNGNGVASICYQGTNGVVMFQ